MDWLDLLAAQGTLKSLLQHHSSKAVEYYSAIRSEILPFAITWMDLEDITLSEMSDEDKYCVTSYMWNLKNTAN